MRKTHQRICFLFILAVGICACSPETAPVSNLEATYTALVMTLSAPAATTAFLPSDSPTPSPTAQGSPTLEFTLAPSRTATRPPVSSGPLCDDSAYVSDVTIPDGTVMKPGEEFIKTWSIRNTGTCSWTTAYTLALTSGNAMDGSTTYMPRDIDAGDTIEISVGLVAPATAGTHTGYWRLKNANGAFFGEWVSVQIVVSGSGANTPAPGPTYTPIPTDTWTPSP